MVAILRLKKYLRLLRFDALLLNNFLEWPLVFCVSLTLRQIRDYLCVIYSWYYFVSFNHVPRTLLYVSVGRPSSLSHWSYGKFLKPGINFVALFCTCSIVSISCFWCGIHTKLDTSRCGLTMLMYSCQTPSVYHCLQITLWSRERPKSEMHRNNPQMRNLFCNKVE